MSVNQKRASRRVLATVLFTDIVDSTRLASELGDERWKELLARHHDLVRRCLKRHGGRELDTAGDGFFASFKEPAEAVRCACDISASVQELGIEVRAGVHLGECEVMGRKLAGISVVIGSRIMSLGGAGDVLLSAGTRDVITGAGFTFEDRGTNVLKGVDGTWPVFSVTTVDGQPRPLPLPPGEAEVRRDTVGAPRHRRRAGLLGIAALVLVAAVLAILALESLGRHGITAIPADAIGRIDAVSGHIVATLPAGSNPTAIVVTSTAVWVADTDAQMVEQIDPATGATNSFGLSGKPTALTVDEQGDVWVLSGFTGGFAQISRRDGRWKVVEQWQLPDTSGYSDLTVAGGSVWVSDEMRGRLVQVDVLTSATRSLPLPAGAEPTGVTSSEGTVWAVAGTSLYRVIASEEAVQKIADLQWVADDLVAGDGYLWMLHTRADTITEVSAHDPSTISTIEVGNQPQALAYGQGALWVANYLDGTITRITPTAGAPQSFPLGGRPWGVGAGGAGVWVSVPGTISSSAP